MIECGGNLAQIAIPLRLTRFQIKSNWFLLRYAAGLAYALLALFGGLMLGVFATFLTEFLDKIRQERQELARYWREGV